MSKEKCHLKEYSGACRYAKAKKVVAAEVQKLDEFEGKLTRGMQSKIEPKAEAYLKYRGESAHINRNKKRRDIGNYEALKFNYRLIRKKTRG